MFLLLFFAIVAIASAIAAWAWLVYLYFTHFRPKKLIFNKKFLRYFKKYRYFLCIFFKDSLSEVSIADRTRH